MYALFVLSSLLRTGVLFPPCIESGRLWQAILRVVATQFLVFVPRKGMELYFALQRLENTFFFIYQFFSKTIKLKAHLQNPY